MNSVPTIEPMTIPATEPEERPAAGQDWEKSSEAEMMVVVGSEEEGGLLTMMGDSTLAGGGLGRESGSTVTTWRVRRGE